jgi:hypothetical protein
MRYCPGYANRDACQLVQPFPRSRFEGRLIDIEQDVRQIDDQSARLLPCFQNIRERPVQSSLYGVSLALCLVGQVTQLLSFSAGEIFICLGLDRDFDGALEAMTAPELRSFVRCVLDGLAAAARGEIVDELMARAAQGHSGWKPTRPSPRIVDDAKSFADAARQLGHADPDDVSEHLRRGTKAFLAGDNANAPR